MITPCWSRFMASVAFRKSMVIIGRSSSWFDSE
jgi:hypothetical protein